MTKKAGQVVLLGGRGMLGTDLERTLRQVGFGVEVFDLPEFDITDAGQLRAAVGRSDVIINCAAYTNVDGAECEAESAYDVNAAAVGRLGELAKANDSYVMHISTDFVFDGRKSGPYVERDAPNPLSVYGRTKYQGEQLLAAGGCRHCIIRVQWTYGAAGNNFVARIIELSKTLNELKVIDDQIGSPTATTEVAGVICELLSRNRPPEGLFHFAAAGQVSRYDQARFIFDKLGVDIDIKPCKTSDYASAAARPLNSRFNCEKIQRLLSEPIRDWRGPLEEFLERL
ncbi:MAG: dTDP-4-dehydrorhamnose reductase [Planctomycetota bacterium]|nr:MAG: dTDP-4-dehydrorhamnose reductase [Planctomycetota bacterium]